MSGEKSKKTSKPSAGKTTGKATGKTASKASKATTGKTAAGKPSAKTAGKAASKTEKAPAKTEKAPARGTSTRHTPPKTLPKQAVAKHVANDTSHLSPVEWQAFVEKMEQSLSTEKSEIMENLIASNNDFKEIVEGMDPKDLADIASDDIDRRMIEALGSQELKRLKSIDSALTRIKQGKYGHCIKCNKRIPPDRLEAIPYALMCIECKSDEERRNR